MSDLAISLHDVRASAGADSWRMIENVVSVFDAPVTVHLVVDAPIVPGTPLCDRLTAGVAHGELEVVFHGIEHKLAKKRRGPLVLFHKNEAEYLDDSPLLRKKTKSAYCELSKVLGTTAGICPPCWLSSKGNARFFESLRPAYTESLLHLRRAGESVFSPVVSLGSSRSAELVLLKSLAWSMWFISILKKNARVRMAIHVVDLPIAGSMRFFERIRRSLAKRGFRPVFQKELWG